MHLQGGQAAQKHAAGGHLARPSRVGGNTVFISKIAAACRQQQQQAELLNNACIARPQVPGSHKAQHCKCLCPSPGCKVACQNPQHASHWRKPERDLHICCRYLQAGLHRVSSPTNHRNALGKCSSLSLASVCIIEQTCPRVSDAPAIIARKYGCPEMAQSQYLVIKQRHPTKKATPKRGLSVRKEHLMLMQGHCSFEGGPRQKQQGLMHRHSKCLCWQNLSSILEREGAEATSDVT